MLKEVYELIYDKVDFKESYGILFLAQSNCEDYICELYLLMNEILYNDNNIGLDLIYKKIDKKTIELIDILRKNKQFLTSHSYDDYISWLRTFNNDPIKYCLCANVFSCIENNKDINQKDKVFNFVCALNMDRRHKIYDMLCKAVEKKYGDIPLKYFLSYKDVSYISEYFNLEKALVHQRDLNKVHCGIIQVLKTCEQTHKGIDKDKIELFKKFDNIKISTQYDRESVKVILTVFYLLEDYFMYRWEYIKKNGYDKFLEKYICFDK